MLRMMYTLTFMKKNICVFEFSTLIKKSDLASASMSFNAASASTFSTNYLICITFFYLYCEMHVFYVSNRVYLRSLN